jgi:hypothetical protein
MCNLASSVSLDCRENSGGVRVIYIRSLTGGTMTMTATSGAITSFTADTTTYSATTGLTTAPFYKIEVPKQTAVLTETGTFSDENGTAFFTQTLSIPVNKLDSTKQVILEQLAKSERLAVVVEDNNGSRWILGNTLGAIAISSTGGTGTSFGDRNGWVIELQALSTSPMYEVNFAS